MLKDNNIREILSEALILSDVVTNAFSVTTENFYSSILKIAGFRGSFNNFAQFRAYPSAGVFNLEMLEPKQLQFCAL